MHGSGRGLSKPAMETWQGGSFLLHQIFEEKAIAIDPGLQSGDDMKAMIENNRRNKIGKLCYLSLCDITGAMKIEKMLNTISRELLPISNTKQLEHDDVKYLNFDEALDSIAGCEPHEQYKKQESTKSTSQNTVNEVDMELIDELKKDFDGMFL